MKISIFGGAGTVGSNTAFAIATQGLANELVLLDVNKDLLINHVIDINTAVPLHSKIVVRAGQNEDISGTDIAIIAAGINFAANTPANERLSKNLPVILEAGKSIEKYCPGAIVITATNPIDLLNYALYTATSLDPKKLIGYNLNDSTRFRIASARALGLDTHLVDGYVWGEHPAGQVMLCSSLRVNGKPVSIAGDFKNQVVEEIQKLQLWTTSSSLRTAGWTTATGLATMVRTIVENSQQVLPCSIIVNGEYGYKNISIGLSAVIGITGIKEILNWNLLPDEQEKLNEAAISLEKGCQWIRQALGPAICIR